MASLDEIWATRTDMTKVAHRLSDPLDKYVSLGWKSPEAAGVAAEDRTATDWGVYELIPHDCDELDHPRCTAHGVSIVLLP